jgi:hypothetical protein
MTPLTKLYLGLDIGDEVGDLNMVPPESWP